MQEVKDKREALSSQYEDGLPNYLADYFDTEERRILSNEFFKEKYRRRNYNSNNIKEIEEYNEKFTLDLFFQTLVTNKNPIIIDVGAHYGESAEFFKKIFPKSLIYSLEPDPESFSKLKLFEAEGFFPIEMGVASTSGKKTFYRYGLSHLNSLSQINASSNDSVGYAKIAPSEMTSIEITTTTLDDFVNKYE